MDYIIHIIEANIHRHQELGGAHDRICHGRTNDVHPSNGNHDSPRYSEKIVQK